MATVRVMREPQAVEKIPSIEQVKKELSDLVALTGRLGDKLRSRMNAHCQTDDAQVLGMVQASLQVLVFAHDKMTPL
jgi:hypothetical protein